MPSYAPAFTPASAWPAQPTMETRRPAQSAAPTEEARQLAAFRLNIEHLGRLYVKMLRLGAVNAQGPGGEHATRAYGQARQEYLDMLDLLRG